MLNTEILERALHLNEMDEEIRELGDEYFLDRWLTYGVPDEATASMLVAIAEDATQYQEIVDIFDLIMEEAEEVAEEARITERASLGDNW